jgi:hypothetical protein
MLFCQIVVPYLLVPYVQGMTYYTALLLAQILLQFPVVMYLVITGTNPLKLISLKLIHPGAAVLVILMTLCVLPLTSLVNLISMLFVDNALTDLSVEVEQNSFWLNLLFIAVIPALSEEFVFRGVIFHTLKEHGKWFAVVCSALFFGMMHLNFNQFSYTFVIGMVMALAVLATGSLWGSVLVHFTLNANSVIMMKVLQIIAQKFSDASGSASGILEQAGTETISTGDLLLTIVVVAIFAAIMLIPAGCFLYAIAHICKRTDELKPMFFPEKKKRTEKDLMKIIGEEEWNEEVDRELDEECFQSRIFDVFFILCVVISFGYMTYIAVI